MEAVPEAYHADEQRGGHAIVTHLLKGKSEGSAIVAREASAEVPQPLPGLVERPLPRLQGIAKEEYPGSSTEYRVLWRRDRGKPVSQSLEAVREAVPPLVRRGSLASKRKGFALAPPVPLLDA